MRRKMKNCLRQNVNVTVFYILQYTNHRNPKNEGMIGLY